MDIPHFFIHSSIKGCMGCLHFLTIMHNTIKNICVQVFYEHVSSWVYMKEWNFWSHMVTLFNFLKDQIVFQSKKYHLQSYQ